MCHQNLLKGGGVKKELFKVTQINCFKNLNYFDRDELYKVTLYIKHIKNNKKLIVFIKISLLIMKSKVKSNRPGIFVSGV